MSHRRRAALLGGLALVLGALAAGDVSRREAALRDRLGPVVPVVLVQRDVAPGDRITATALAVRRVPARYAPAGAFTRPGPLIGARSAVAIGAGTDLVPALLDDGTARAPTGAPVRRGERIAELIARGSPELVRAGSRVDVLVTQDEPAGGGGRTRIALQDAEVLAAAPAPGGEDREATAGDRVAVSLRVTLRQAVTLAAAEQYAREVRVLPRAAGDRGRAR